jgi:murein DD-endopeptidase MepM/ murein hydrolase activator NlpD
MNQLSALLYQHRPYAPVLPVALTTHNTVTLDFSAGNSALAAMDVRDTAALGAYVSGCIAAAGAIAGIGGYNEERVIYRRSPLFADAAGHPRYIHLGVDAWINAGTAVHAPLKGIVHALQDNKGFGDYGPTVILQHQLEGLVFFTLYGHLSVRSLTHTRVGDVVLPGQQLGWIGPAPENGDWPPHLHFQVIADDLQGRGDYPGVCSLPEREHYLWRCPDPNIILGMVL